MAKSGMLIIDTKVSYALNLQALAKWGDKALPRALRESMALVRKEAKNLAPRSAAHKSRRSYGGKRYWDNEPTIRKSIYSRVKFSKKIGKWVAFAKAWVGYSIMQNFGWTPASKKPTRKIAGLFFMEKALANKESEIFVLLKRAYDEESFARAQKGLN